MSEMTIIVPTRNRPQNVDRMLDAWRETGAFGRAELLFVVDADDPTLEHYQMHLQEAPEYGAGLFCVIESEWRPLVPKLNKVALAHAQMADRPIGFMGDDHLPRTPGWASAYLAEFEHIGTGVVSCPDGYRRDQIPTQWAMTADIVRALGKMVPAPVEHMYCDNSVRDLALVAGCYRWLPDLLVEHVHPYADKAEWDAGYLHVNDPKQYSRDSTTYAIWTYRDMRRDAAKISALRGVS